MTAPTQRTSEAAFDALLGNILRTYPAGRADYAAYLDGLGQGDRHLLVVQGLHSQVCNGGLRPVDRNGYLRRDIDVLLALAPVRRADVLRPA